MEKGLQTIFATIVGAVLILVGLLGFINNPVLGLFPVNPLHNLVHLITGAVFLWAGVWGGAAPARMVNKFLGIIYVVVALVGFIPGGLLNFLAIDLWDNLLHLVLGAVAGLIGFWGSE